MMGFVRFAALCNTYIHTLRYTDNIPRSGKPVTPSSTSVEIQSL